MTELAAAHSESPNPQHATRAIPAWLWAALFVGLSIYVANRMDAFDWFADVALPGGVTARLAVGYASVDHPFHATRAETLRRSLADGDLLRWIGNHQGGYPVEFYPLGVAWLEVGIWAVLLGSLPLMVVHKLTIVIVFLLPGLAYVFFCRRDRLTPGIALFAFAAHVAVGGWWWSGGYMELALWGLVTNVAANVALLFVLPSLTGYLKFGELRAAATAALFAGFAVVTNPRSLIALATICAGVVIAIVIERLRTNWRAGELAMRLIVVLGIAALLAAPELISLLRFSNLYYFVHYSGYADLAAYLDSSVQAVSGPIFIFSILGTLSGLVVPGRTLTRGTAITLVLYAALTAYLSTDAAAKTLVEQLETTRLMPFQRYLMIYLAAVGLYDALRWLCKLVTPASKLAVDFGLAGLSALVMVLYVVSPPDFIPEGDRGLYKIPSTARPEIADLEAAVKLADDEAAPGTALLVLGSDVSWHDGLWSPMWSDRPFFYDDWLWYWQKKHFGDYNPESEHAYPRDDSTLSEEYLRRHGIGALVVTGEARAVAANSPLLEVVHEGLHDVYVVRDPTTIVTFDDRNSTATGYGNEAISASGEGSGGTATIRRNWFPRWSANVNGESVPITETDDGYMTVPIPEGDTALDLKYEVDSWDWLARLLSVAGFAAVVFLLLPRRWAGRSGEAGQEFDRPALN